MKSTIDTIEGTELPKRIVTLNEARNQTTDDTLDETMKLAMLNGYFLTGVEDHDIFGVQYTLEKLEVEE